MIDTCREARALLRTQLGASAFLHSVQEQGSEIGQSPMVLGRQL